MGENLSVKKNEVSGPIFSEIDLESFDAINPEIREAYNSLSINRQIFVTEYLMNGQNGEKAAIKCGCGAKYAQVAAVRILKDKLVSRFFELLMGHALERAGIGPEWIIAKIKNVIKEAEAGNTNKFGDYDAKYVLSALDMLCKMGNFYTLQSINSDSAQGGSVDASDLIEITKQLNSIIKKDF